MIGQSKAQSGTQKKRLSKNGVSSELPPLFVAADQNKDGYVSKDEAQKDGVPCSTLMLLINRS
jgi:hypothetical protein